MSLTLPRFLPQTAERLSRGVAVAALAATVAHLMPLPASAEVVNGVVLRINDQIATAHDYQNQLTDRRQAIRMAEMPEEQRQQMMADSGQQVYREIYEELLLRSRAKQLGIFATQAEIDNAVAQAKERMGIQTESEMEQALIASGLTLDELRTKMENTLLVQQVVGREIRSKIEIEDDELRKIYRENEAELTIPAARLVEEVVVLEEPTPDLEARRGVIADLMSAIDGGADFADAVDVLAESGVTSGVIDLGWVEPGHLAPELDRAVWDLEVGAFSAPVEARGGSHILRVLEVREETVRPFDEVRDLLLARERDTRMAEAYKDYLREVEANAFIEMQIPPDAAGFRGLGASEEAETHLDASSPDLTE